VALSEPVSDLAPTAAETETAAAAPAPAAAAAPARAKPAPAKPAIPAAPPAVAPDDSAKQLYSRAVGRIEGGDYTGVESLRRAANLGYAPAQFYLAKLHEGGTGGVKKDTAEARRWYERAAQAGDAKAMHNLALFYFEGVGGEKNLATAATWFRRAADRGLQDSQYNLARLYEMGAGVAQNAAEAYKWYLVSGAAGDKESKDSAERIKPKLSPEAQLAAQRAAVAYRAQIAGARVASAP
jgi:localization factor PodJL